MLESVIEQKKLAQQREQRRAVGKRNQSLIAQWQAEVQALERVRDKLR